MQLTESLLVEESLKNYSSAAPSLYWYILMLSSIIPSFSNSFVDKIWFRIRYCYYSLVKVLPGILLLMYWNKWLFFSESEMQLANLFSLVIVLSIWYIIMSEVYVLKDAKYWIASEPIRVAISCLPMFCAKTIMFQKKNSWEMWAKGLDYFLLFLRVGLSL